MRSAVLVESDSPVLEALAAGTVTKASKKRSSSCSRREENQRREARVGEARKPAPIASSSTRAALAGQLQNCEKKLHRLAPELGACMCGPLYSHQTTG